PAEKAGVARRRLGCRRALELTDAGVGPFEGFVQHQHGLDQRIGGVGGLPQAIPDQAFGLGIALSILERGQPVEQFNDEIAFLWGHWSPPSSLTTPVHVGNARESGMTSIHKKISVGFPRPTNGMDKRGGDHAKATPWRASTAGNSSPAKKAYSRSRSVVRG